LTADLHCTAQSGLRVTADNTTINLNGHTLSCTGAGFGGSCQKADGQVPTNTRGIESQHFNNVKIAGPGTITGFETGILVTYGAGHTISGVTIDGPSVPLAQNHRDMAAGIYLAAVNCSTSGTGKTAVISSNDVSNQAAGIHVESSSCVEVRGNQIRDINRGQGLAFGMSLYKVYKSSFYRNTVTGVGLNRQMDSGIVSFQYTGSNQIYSNTVSNNCGNGILMRPDSAQNTTSSNVARFNGTSSQQGRCDAPAPLGGAFGDLVDQNPLLSNTWNTNNICRVQLGNISAGVCGPNE
jgi:nitrous oxidase accessory protein NosD